jgi:hypothetical protein
MAVSRLRLKDMLESRLPGSVGLCASDVGQVASMVNAAQERLLTCREAGDTGWWGSYAEVGFVVTQNDPYITLPRGMARLIRLDACDYPIRPQNQFYEYLEFGSGHWPKLACNTTNVCQTGPALALRRNMVATQSDLTTPGYGLRIYASVEDATLTTIVSGTDANGQNLSSYRNSIPIKGLANTLTNPFSDLTLVGSTAAIELGSIYGIQKDTTARPVSFYEVNLTTGTQRLLLTMEPSEKVAAYSRYYLNGLPDGCCPTPGTAQGDNAVTIKAMVKLDLIPCVAATDYLLIQSREALIEECQSIRLGDMDSSGAKGQAAERHRNAVRYLQGQLVHYEGKSNPATNFAPFGTARLVNQMIGYQM